MHIWNTYINVNIFTNQSVTSTDMSVKNTDLSVHVAKYR